VESLWLPLHLSLLRAHRQAQRACLVGSLLLRLSLFLFGSSREIDLAAGTPIFCSARLPTVNWSSQLSNFRFAEIIFQ